MIPGGVVMVQHRLTERMVQTRYGRTVRKRLRSKINSEGIGPGKEVVRHIGKKRAKTYWQSEAIREGGVRWENFLF